MNTDLSIFNHILTTFRLDLNFNSSFVSLVHYVTQADNFNLNAQLLLFFFYAVKWFLSLMLKFFHAKFIWLVSLQFTNFNGLDLFKVYHVWNATIKCNNIFIYTRSILRYMWFLLGEENWNLETVDNICKEIGTFYLQFIS